MKIKVNKDFAESLGIGSIFLPFAIALPPAVVAYAIFAFAFSIHDKENTETIEVDVDPLSGMQEEEARRQYNDWIHHLKQMAVYGTYENRNSARRILNGLRVKY